MRRVNKTDRECCDRIAATPPPPPPAPDPPFNCSILLRSHVSHTQQYLATGRPGRDAHHFKPRTYSSFKTENYKPSENSLNDLFKLPPCISASLMLSNTGVVDPRVGLHNTVSKYGHANTIIITCAVWLSVVRCCCVMLSAVMLQSNIGQSYSSSYNTHPCSS